MYRILNIKELFDQFITHITNYNIYLSIIVVSVILMVLLLKYKSKQTKVLISTVSIITISSIIYYYSNDLSYLYYSQISKEQYDFFIKNTFAP